MEWCNVPVLFFTLMIVREQSNLLIHDSTVGTIFSHILLRWWWNDVEFQTSIAVRSFPKILIQALIEDFPEGGPIHQKSAPHMCPGLATQYTRFTHDQRNAILV